MEAPLPARGTVGPIDGEERRQESVLIYESSLRTGHGYRESPHRHHGCFKASDCGRLGRQAADHPWSALRVVKSCRKELPNGLGAARSQSSSSASRTVPELTI